MSSPMIEAEVRKNLAAAQERLRQAEQQREDDLEKGRERTRGSGAAQPPSEADQTNTLTRQVNAERERLGILGELATSTERLTARHNELVLAQRTGKAITDDERKSLEALLASQLSAAEIAKRTQYGVATEEERRAQYVTDLNAAIAKGTVKESDRTQIMALYNRGLKETIENEKVRASSTPQLTRLSLDAADLSKNLDTELAGALRGSTSDMIAMTNGTMTLGDGFKSLSKRILEAVENAILLKTVVGALTNAVTGAFASSFAPAAPDVYAPGFNTQSFGGPRAAGGPVVPGMSYLVGEKRPELFTPDRAGWISPSTAPLVSQNGGAAAPSVNINVHNNTGVATNATTKTNSDGSIDVILDAIEARQASRMSRGRGPLYQAVKKPYPPHGWEK